MFIEEELSKAVEIKIENVSFFTEENEDLFNGKEKKYYLKISYIGRTLAKKFRVVFPKVRLDFSCQPEIVSSCNTCFSSPFVNLNLEYMSLEKITHNEEEIYCYLEILEEYPREMSIEEIEKELGYKIIIVNEKKK